MLTSSIGPSKKMVRWSKFALKWFWVTDFANRKYQKNIGLNWSNLWNILCSCPKQTDSAAQKTGLKARVDQTSDLETLEILTMEIRVYSRGCELIILVRHKWLLRSLRPFWERVLWMTKTPAQTYCLEPPINQSGLQTQIQNQCVDTMFLFWQKTRQRFLLQRNVPVFWLQLVAAWATSLCLRGMVTHIGRGHPPTVWIRNNSYA